MTTDDFTFACEGVGLWDALRVVRFHGKEALSELYRYEVVLLAASGDLAVADLVGKRCSLRIATLSTPALKVVHGVVVEAEEIAALPEGRTLRVVFMPPWARAQHRRRCRIFLDKTLRRIIEAVMQGDPLMKKSDGSSPDPDEGGPDFTPAKEAFAFRVKDAFRLDDKRVRSYVVQYNESDFAFVSRLLEEEGIAYHFENGADTSLLVFSDSDAGRPRLEPDAVGAGIDGREVRAFRAGSRLRPEGVVLGDYTWKQPDMEMMARAGKESAALSEYVYPGGFLDDPKQGQPLARAVLGRHKTEARFAQGEGWLRVLSAGSILRMEHAKARLEGEYVVASLDVRGEQAGVLKSSAQSDKTLPFVAAFECARRGESGAVRESNFRPARSTPKPRISGTQTAVVTAEPSAKDAEINVGGPDGIDVGCVKLRFHWDTEEARLAKEPSSAWVRVSEPTAGAGMGGVWHPRVGTEVIVKFEEGDPDRPLVVGRVYNGVNRPHRGGAAPVSTFKSNASPGGGVHNEITFDDSGGGELIYTNAGKDMVTEVGNNRTETVASNASMSVGADDTENIGANCTVMIGSNDTLTVGANESNTIGGNSVTSIGANCLQLVGGSESFTIGANQTITIGANQLELVGGAVTETIGGSLTTDVGAAEFEGIGGSRTTTIAGSHTQDFGAVHVKLVGGNRTLECGPLTTTIGAASVRIAGGSITTNVGGSQNLSPGGGAIFITPHYINQDSNRSDTDGFKFEKALSMASIGGAEVVAAGLAQVKISRVLAAAGAVFEAYGAKIYLIKLWSKIEAAQVHTKGVKGRVGFLIPI
jgi:type VI secretion system secreted protein VgrG